MVSIPDTFVEQGIEPPVKSGLKGPSVLVVEDELLVGMDLAMLIEDWGYAADGPHPNAKAALKAIGKRTPELALLDINLGRGETSSPVAARLRELGTPFILLTGYGVSRYDRYDAVNDAAAHLRKPVTERELRVLLDRICPISR